MPLLIRTRENQQSSFVWLEQRARVFINIEVSKNYASSRWFLWIFCTTAVTVLHRRNCILECSLTDYHCHGAATLVWRAEKETEHTRTVFVAGYRQHSVSWGWRSSVVSQHRQKVTLRFLWTYIKSCSVEPFGPIINSPELVVSRVLKRGEGKVSYMYLQYTFILTHWKKHMVKYLLGCALLSCRWRYSFTPRCLYSLFQSVGQMTS